MLVLLRVVVCWMGDEAIINVDSSSDNVLLLLLPLLLPLLLLLLLPLLLSLLESSSSSCPPVWLVGGGLRRKHIRNNQRQQITIKDNKVSATIKIHQPHPPTTHHTQVPLFTCGSVVVQLLPIRRGKDPLPT